MRRAFQTAVGIFQPEVIFFLGGVITQVNGLHSPLNKG